VSESDEQYNTWVASWTLAKSSNEQIEIEHDLALYINSLHDKSVQKRKNDLIDQIISYYKKTENMNNFEARKEKMELMDWCLMEGYSNKEYQEAKKIASGINY
jgi:hypothetical protein